MCLCVCFYRLCVYVYVCVCVCVYVCTLSPQAEVSTKVEYTGRGYLAVIGQLSTVTPIGRQKTGTGSGRGKADRSSGGYRDSSSDTHTHTHTHTSSSSVYTFGTVHTVCLFVSQMLSDHRLSLAI